MGSLGIFALPTQRRVQPLRGLGVVPSQYWADDRVKTAQNALNYALQAAGCAGALKADGLIGPQTCGAVLWVKGRGGSIPVVASNQSDFDAACKKVGSTPPACSALAPPPPAPVRASPPATHAPVIVDIPSRGPAPAYTSQGPNDVAPVRPPIESTSQPYVPTGPVSMPVQASSGSMSTGMKVAIGAGAVALVAFAVMAKSKKRAA